MVVTIHRKTFNPNETLGEMIVDGVHFGYTLEDKDRGLHSDMSVQEIKLRKVFGKTAIPYGKYELVLTYSNRFKKAMPLLLKVKGFEGVRIHGGNEDEDTLGCPLLGAKQNANGISDCATVNAKFISLLKNQLEIGKVYITITK